VERAKTFAEVLLFAVKRAKTFVEVLLFVVERAKTFAEGLSTVDLSDYRVWSRHEHVDKWLLFPENLGTHLSIDETSLTNGELLANIYG
ncbi:MAG: hypothetical protein ACOH2V_05065, partial [Candidatus Saccharimonadaceae bacterium]